MKKPYHSRKIKPGDLVCCTTPSALWDNRTGPEAAGVLGFDEVVLLLSLEAFDDCYRVNPGDFCTVLWRCKQVMVWKESLQKVRQ